MLIKLAKSPNLDLFHSRKKVESLILNYGFPNGTGKVRKRDLYQLHDLQIKLARPTDYCSIAEKNWIKCCNLMQNHCILQTAVCVKSILFKESILFKILMTFRMRTLTFIQHEKTLIIFSGWASPAFTCNMQMSTPSPTGRWGKSKADIHLGKGNTINCSHVSTKAGGRGRPHNSSLRWIRQCGILGLWGRSLPEFPWLSHLVPDTLRKGMFHGRSIKHPKYFSATCQLFVIRTHSTE